MAALAVWAAVALAGVVGYLAFCLIRAPLRWASKRRMSRGELRFYRRKYPTVYS